MDMTVSAGKKEKGDAFVTVSAHPGGGVNFQIISPVRELFSRQQDAAVSLSLTGLKARDLDVTVDDYQALDFVLAARVKAAVLRFRRREEKL